MAYSFAVTTASGSTPNVVVPFGFISRSHVHVSLDGVQLDDDSLTWNSDSQIALEESPEVGTVVRVYRETPADSLLATFANPNVLDAKDINTVLKHMLYVTQEAFDKGESNSDELGAITSYVNNAMAVTGENAEASAVSAADALAYKNLALSYMETAQGIATGTFPWRGGWDPTSGAFPSGASERWMYKATTEGEVGGISFAIGDSLFALVDAPSTSVYADNWLKVGGVAGPDQVIGSLGYTPADSATTVSGGGIASGGGDLTANRTITVNKASGAEVTAGTEDGKAVTPKALKDSGIITGGPKLALYQEQRASGASGPVYTTGDWRHVPLSTEVFDEDDIGALADNMVTLGPGTYRADGYVIGRRSSEIQVTGRARLYNATDSTVIAQGLNQTAFKGDTLTFPVQAVFTLTEAKAVRLQVRQVSAGTDSNTPLSVDDVEVYVSLLIEKIK